MMKGQYYDKAEGEIEGL